MLVCRCLLPNCRHVAGTIGARGGNGLGVAGVNWNIKLLSGKFLGSTGGTTANAVKAVGEIPASSCRTRLASLLPSWLWGVHAGAAAGPVHPGGRVAQPGLPEVVCCASLTAATTCCNHPVPTQTTSQT